MTFPYTTDPNTIHDRLSSIHVPFSKLKHQNILRVTTDADDRLWIIWHRIEVNVLEYLFTFSPT